jgi:hypothetical protein
VWAHATSGTRDAGECACLDAVRFGAGYASFDYEPAADREADVVMVRARSAVLTYARVCESNSPAAAALGSAASLLHPSPLACLASFHV